MSSIPRVTLSPHRRISPASNGRLGLASPPRLALLLFAVLGPLALASCTVVVETPTPGPEGAANPRAPEASYQAHRTTLSDGGETQTARPAAPGEGHETHDHAVGEAAPRNERHPHAGHPPTSVESASQEVLLYSCPMHPDEHQHEPGKCPICGTDMVARTPPGD